MVVLPGSVSRWLAEAGLTQAGRQRQRQRPGAQAGRRAAQQHALACKKGKMRVGMNEHQTLWSQWVAFQTFYELSLTREKERNWVQDSLELKHHGNISHVLQVKPLISEDEQIDLHYLCGSQGLWATCKQRHTSKICAARKSLFYFSYFIRAILTPIDRVGGLIAYYYY